MIEGLIAECDQVSARAWRRPSARLRALGAALLVLALPVGNHGENLPSMLGAGVDQ